MSKWTLPSAKKNVILPDENANGVFMEVGFITTFAGRFFKEVFRPRYEVNAFLTQAYIIGYTSLPLVAATAFIMGLVLSVQSLPMLSKFGAESWLPGMVAVSIVREIGPVLTALICAGKVGSRIGAELSAMRVSEQIDAMEVSGTNPFKYLVVTRIAAATLMLPVLVAFADAIAMVGSYIAVNIGQSVSLRLFFFRAFQSLDFSDVFPAFIKTFFFGFAIGLISCYKGYTTNKGTAGVGTAANSSVVVSSLLIFIIDMIAVQLSTLIINAMK